MRMRLLRITLLKVRKKCANCRNKVISDHYKQNTMLKIQYFLSYADDVKIKFYIIIHLKVTLFALWEPAEIFFGCLLIYIRISFCCESVKLSNCKISLKTICISTIMKTVTFLISTDGWRRVVLNNGITDGSAFSRDSAGTRSIKHRRVRRQESTSGG